MSKIKKRSQNKVKIQTEYVKKHWHWQLSNFEGETNGKIVVKRDNMESVEVLD